jgi:hypothetical protein
VGKVAEGDRQEINDCTFGGIRISRAKPQTTARKENNKSEARNPKFETNSNDEKQKKFKQTRLVLGF